ncbi:MAG: BrnA antitoxin family protein [Spirochaetales bacterium]|nr:BrnA antitoxin family protein [Spirochaetales bacterium]
MKNSSNLTQEQIEELRKLDSYPVDYSDIPQRTDFSKAKFKYYELKPKKEVVTIRLDSDLMAVLRSYGKGYQTKVNEALRAAFM